MNALSSLRDALASKIPVGVRSRILDFKFVLAFKFACSQTILNFELSCGTLRVACFPVGVRCERLVERF